MVGDADAVEAAFAVKINNLRYAQFAVGIIRMDMEIAQEHLGGLNGAAGGRLRCAHDAFKCVVKKLHRFSAGKTAFTLFQNELCDFHGGVGPADFLQIFPPLVPKRGFLFEGHFNRLGHFLVLFHNGANI